MESNEAIRVERRGANVDACARMLNTGPVDRKDVTWHPGDQQGHTTIEGVAGQVRMFAGEPARIVFWPALPVDRTTRRAISRHLQNILDASAGGTPYAYDVDDAIHDGEGRPEA